jgi:hypothetical protein
MQSTRSNGNHSIYVWHNVQMQKFEWVQHIDSTLATGKPWSVKMNAENKAVVLFACDVFRRRKHDVRIGFDPTPDGTLGLHATVFPKQEALEFTLRRDQEAAQIIEEMKPVHVRVVSLRGCGTVINTVCDVMEWALHHGWFVQKTFLNTLTHPNHKMGKQKNTTLVAVLRRGSDIGSI